MRTLFVALCFAAIQAMAADMYSFAVPNSMSVSGPAGVETGWGYSLHNESSSLWLVTTDLTAATFQHATPDLIFDFPDLAPEAAVTVPYDPLTLAGLYQIGWDTDTPPGFVNSGVFRLTAEWWNGDPLAEGTFVSSAPSANASYTTAAVPEPATLGLTAILLSVFCVVCSFRRQTPSRN